MTKTRAVERVIRKLLSKLLAREQSELQWISTRDRLPNISPGMSSSDTVWVSGPAFLFARGVYDAQYGAWLMELKHAGLGTRYVDSWCPIRSSWLRPSPLRRLRNYDVIGKTLGNGVA